MSSRALRFADPTHWMKTALSVFEGRVSGHDLAVESRSARGLSVAHLRACGRSAGGQYRDPVLQHFLLPVSRQSALEAVDKPSTWERVVFR
jgi:hypothetical protein